MKRSLRSMIAIALLLPLAACGGDDDGTTTEPVAAPTPATTTEPTTEPTAEPSNEPVATPSAPAGARAVAVYYLRDTDNGPRLYREFHRRPAVPAVIRDAVDAMLHDLPIDGDYTSLWPRATQVLGVDLDGDLATVDLSAAATRGNAGAAFEGVSVQQLVHTVTAAAPAVRRVQLLVEGRPVESLWGHVDTRRPIGREPQENVLGPVWILTPNERATVARTFTVGGEATVFEATVSWELRQGDTVVRKGFTTATEGGPGRGTWSAGVTAPGAGSYEIRAFESSAEDGRPMFVDTKTVTVR